MSEFVYVYEPRGHGGSEDVWRAPSLNAAIRLANNDIIYNLCEGGVKIVFFHWLKLSGGGAYTCLPRRYASRPIKFEVSLFDLSRSLM